MKLFLALLIVPSLLGAQKPTEGKVLIQVAAGEAGTYKDVQQRASDLQDTARDIRRRLGKSKWLELTSDDTVILRLVPPTGTRPRL